MVESSNKPVVVITGVTGFLGSQVLNEFLNGEGAGQYKIRATVRDKTNLAKLKPLQDFFGEKLSEVEFFNADLNDAQSLENAIKGSDFVIHTASPVGLSNPRNHDDMIKPAVNGVTFAIQAAQKHKIKRIVITSSVAAISHVAPENELEAYDETSWSDVVTADFSAYVKSKTLAERAAWDFQQKMKE